MSDAAADPQIPPGYYEEALARLRRHQVESDRIAEETRKLIAEARKLDAEELKLRAERIKLEAEELKLAAEGKKFSRDATFAPLVAAAAAGAGILAVLQLLFKAAGWLP